MADFDFSTLITDRGQSDLATLRSVLSTPMEEWTAEQLAAFNLAASKGAYNYTDLNRVTACMDNLNERLTALGYQTGYSSVVVHQPQPQQPTLPDGYTELEYIQSSGTQYIDTGFKQNQNSRIVMSAQVTQQPSTHAWLFEGRIRNVSGGKSVFLLDGAVWNADYNGSARREAFPDIGIFDALSIDFDKNSLQINEDSFTWTTSTFQSTANLALLACNTAGAISGYISAKLYNCQIYDNGTMIRDFVPCQDPTGNVGLYDLVGAQFYGNAGSGTFTAGPEVPQPEPEPTLDPYTWYESDVPTESTMSRYLANVSALREVLTLPENTASVPADMSGLTLAEANAIEEILLVIEGYLTALASVFRRCGAAICGGPGFYFKN